MQIMIPLAGKSPFFSPEHYFFPKSLIEVDGTPMIERVIENLASVAEDKRFIFVLPSQDVVRFAMDRTLRLLTDGRCSIVGLGRHQGCAVFGADGDRPARQGCTTYHRQR